MPTQILLYEKREVYASSYGLHQINLINPSFSMSSVTDQDMGWQSRTTDVEWFWSGGSGVASFQYQGYAQPLLQNFPNSPLPDTYYTVQFTVSNLIAGSFRVYIGSSTIAEITTNGVHQITYYSSSGTGLASQILFFPSTSFVGSIDDVSIKQDAALSPPAKEYQFEPLGLLDMEEARVGLSYRVADVQDPSKKFGAYSSTFTLPGTPNNKKVLGHLDVNEATFDGFDARQRWRCVMLADDVEVIRGYFILDEVITEGDQTYYKVQIADDTLGLLSSIRDKKLGQLNTSAWDHPLTHKYVTNTWKDEWTWRTGYYYPFLLQPDEDLHMIDRDFRPSFSVRGIFDRILADAGFTYSLSPLLEDKMNNTVHFPVGPRPKAKLDDLRLYDVRAKSDGSQQWEVAYQFVHNGPINANHDVQRWEANVELQDQMNSYYPDSPYFFFKAPFTGEYEITFSAYTTIVFSVPDFLGQFEPVLVSTDPSITFSLMDMQANVPILTTNRWSFPATLTAPFTEDYIFRITGQTVSLTAGQTIGVRGFIDNGLYDHINLANDYFRYRPGITMTMDDSKSIIEYRLADGLVVGENMPIRVREWLGEQTSQEAFINDMRQAFNLFFLPEKDNERHVYITSRDELYNTIDIIDRSGHVAMDEPITREQLTTVASSVVRFAYSESEEKFNEEYRRLTLKDYGEHTWEYETDLYNGVETVDLSIYTPTPITRDESFRVVPSILGTDEDGKSETRLLVRGQRVEEPVRLRWHEPVWDYTYEYDFPYHRISITSDGVGTGSTFDLNFGEVDANLSNVPIDITANNLFNAHYADQMRDWNDGRLFTCMMRLSVLEVREHLDNLGARVWVEELGGFFILMAIEHFDPTMGDRSLTRVQLLKVGPSERRVSHSYTYSTQPGLVGQATNPVAIGNVPSHHGGTINEVKIGTNNFSNGGPNTLRGSYNNVNGSDNTVYGDANLVLGNGNQIGSNLRGVTILGANNITASTSYTTYFDSLGSVSPTGATFYGEHGWSLGPSEAEFYGPSGLTINAYSGLSFGDVNISRSGITIHGEPVMPAFPCCLPYFDVNDWDMLRFSGESGTWENRDLGYRVSDDAYSWFRLGDNTNFIQTASTQYTSIIGGYLNWIDGPFSFRDSLIASDICTISGSSRAVMLNGSSSMIHAGPSSVTLVGTTQAVMSGDVRFSSMMGGIQNTLATEDIIFAASLIGGWANIITGTSWFSAILGGSGNTVWHRGSTVIGCSGVTTSKEYTTYLNDCHIENLLDLKPRSSLPTPLDGRVFYSAHTGLMLCVGSTWKLVTAV